MTNYFLTVMIKTFLSYILEAYLGNPIYGINHNKIGWIDLNYKPGYPQPLKRLF